MKHLLYLLLLMSIAACSEHSDMIPPIENDKAYYEEHEPNLLWKSEVHLSDPNNQGLLHTAEIVDGSIYAISSVDHTDVLYSIDTADGTKQWSITLPLPDDRQPIRSFQIFKTGNDLYLINDRNLQVYHISQSDGQLYGTTTPAEHGVQEYSFKRPVIIDNYLYFFSLNDNNDLNVIKYNIMDHTYEAIDSIGGISRVINQTEVIYDKEQDRLLFAIHFRNLSQNTRCALYSLDLEDPSIHTIWTDEEQLYFDTELIHINDIIVFQTSSTELIAISLEDETVKWRTTAPFVYQKDHMYALDDELIVNTSSELLSLNIETGSINWITNTGLYGNLYFPAESELIPGFSSIDGNSHTTVSLHDLHDGQNLVNWPLPLDNNGNNVLPRFVIYDSSSQSVFIGSNQNIYKYNRLLP